MPKPNRWSYRTLILYNAILFAPAMIFFLKNGQFSYILAVIYFWTLFIVSTVNIYTFIFYYEICNRSGLILSFTLPLLLFFAVYIFLLDKLPVSSDVLSSCHRGYLLFSKNIDDTDDFHVFDWYCRSYNNRYFFVSIFSCLLIWANATAAFETLRGMRK